VWLAWGDRDAARSSAGLAVRAAAVLLGVPAAGLRLVHEPGGAPRLAGGAAGRVSVSLAHSGGLAAAAVSTLGPVGVDVEPVRPLDALALARRWFRPEESDWLAGLPDTERTEAFLCLWTQKEAVGKALRTGLRGGRGLRRAVLAPVPLPRPDGLDGLRLAPLPDGEEPGLPLAAAVTRVAAPAILAVACQHAWAAGLPVTVWSDHAQ
jgi:4'-phosphopantetheinyl transferase